MFRGVHQVEIDVRLQLLDLELKEVANLEIEHDAMGLGRLNVLATRLSCSQGEGLDAGGRLQLRRAGEGARRPQDNHQASNRSRGG